MDEPDISLVGDGNNGDHDHYVTLDDNDAFQVTKKRSNQMIVTDSKTFNCSQLVVTGDAENNFYFEYLPRKYAINMMKILRVNPIGITIILMISILLWVASTVCSSISNNQHMFFAFYISWNVWNSLWCLLYLLTVDLNIVNFFISTFDFWFKLYNLVIKIVCETIMAKSYYTADVHNSIQWPFEILICVEISAFIIIGFTFFFDGFYFPKPNLKKAVILYISIYQTYFVISTYFKYPNAYWNPFKHLEYTTINFKSLLISSTTTLTLFMMKPVLYELKKFVVSFCWKHKCKYKSYRQANQGIHDDDDDDCFYDNAHSFHKKPIIKWLNLNSRT